MTKNNLLKKRDEIVRYRSHEQLGNERFTPGEMLKIKIAYESSIKMGNYLAVRYVETLLDLPFTWLNVVIYELGRESKHGLADKLAEEFKDRGFTKETFRWEKV